MVKSRLFCKACLDSRVLKGDYDLMIGLVLKNSKTDDLYFRDGKVSMQYTEIAGGLCGDNERACEQ
jgi:hypothetical protein